MALLAPVRAIAASYRMTGKPVPSQASFFVASVLKPLRAFLDEAAASRTAESGTAESGTAESGAVASPMAAALPAAAIGEAGAGIMQALKRNSANLGKAPAPPGTCPICLENFGDASVEAGCGHRFCRECLRTWLKRSNRCPTCRQCLNFAAAPEYLNFGAAAPSN